MEDPVLRSVKNLVLHPVAKKRHVPDRLYSHFDGSDEELFELVKAEIESGNFVPGKFPNTFVVQPNISASRFYGRGERHTSGIAKPVAARVSVILWTAKALEADVDKKSAKKSLELAKLYDAAIVSLHAA